MSNADYRLLEHQAAEARARRLVEARELLAQAAKTQGAQVVDAAVSGAFKRAGGETIDRDIDSLALIIESGDLSRKIEVAQQRNNIMRMAQGQEPIEYPRAAVSSATHRAALRDKALLAQKREKLWEAAEMAAAGELARAKVGSTFGSEKGAESAEASAKARTNEGPSTKNAQPKAATAPPVQSAAA